MLLFFGLVLIALFFGLGFVAKVLWLGIVLGLALIIADLVSGHRRL